MGGELGFEKVFDVFLSKREKLKSGVLKLFFIKDLTVVNPKKRRYKGNPYPVFMREGRVTLRNFFMIVPPYEHKAECIFWFDGLYYHLVVEPDLKFVKIQSTEQAKKRVNSYINKFIGIYDPSGLITKEGHIFATKKKLKALIERAFNRAHNVSELSYHLDKYCIIIHNLFSYLERVIKDNLVHDKLVEYAYFKTHIVKRDGLKRVESYIDRLIRKKSMHPAIKYFRLIHSILSDIQKTVQEVKSWEGLRKQKDLFYSMREELRKSKAFENLKETSYKMFLRRIVYSLNLVLSQLDILLKRSKD